MLTADAVAALPGPDWLRSRRMAAFERVQGAALPTEAEEVWRYSRISELDLERYGPLDGGASVEPGVPAELQPVLAAIGERAGLVVVRNGRVAVADQVDVDAGGEPTADIAGSPDVFVDMNTAQAVEPVVITVRPGTALELPVVVLHWIDADGAAVFPRTVVRVGEGGAATVVEYLASADVDAFVDPVAELDVAAGANLRYLGVQALGPRVWQTAYQASRVERDAALESFTVALGGDYARVRTDSKLVGTGADSQLLAVYFGGGAQMHDFRTLQHHDAPKTTSNLLFKGAVADTARSVYSGLIRIRKGAAGTNAFQTNRNLVLSPGAHADSVPNLEIEENDVKCSHASAVGPIDEEHRYYLESRGVPTVEADRLIVQGFFDDMLERAPIAGLRPVVRDAITAKIEESDALPAEVA